MNYDQEPTNQNISVSLPIKIGFTALKKYLNKEFIGKIISRHISNGKEIKYFKILDIDIDKSEIKNYNIELIVKLETLTAFYNNRSLQISIQALVNMDVDSQKLYVDTYKIDSTGKSWLANQMLESVVNSFVYRKIIKNLNIDLLPLINEKLGQLNDQLAAKIEVKSGISVLGSLENLTITHFEVKPNDIWIIINIIGWGIIDIENLDF